MKIVEDTDIRHASVEATPTGWCLRFSFPGPDARYNHTLVTVSPGDIERLISDYAKAFVTYQRLKEVSVTGKRLTVEHGAWLRINIGPHAEGVCLGGYHLPINTDVELTSMIANLRKVLERGPILAHEAASLS